MVADLRLRPAELSDASSLAALSIEVWVGTYLRHGVNGFFADFVLSDLTVTKFEELVQNPGESLIVSLNRDGIYGYIRVSRNRPAPLEGVRDGEISTLYVQPRHHGRLVGRALLQRGLEICGAARPWLMVNTENENAIAFYQRNGFRQTGQTHFEIGDQGYLNWIFTYDG